VVATLLALAALAACGSSTPSEPASHSVTPLTPSTSAPVSPSPTATPSTSADDITLLPRSCTKADGIYVASTLRNGAGGVSYDYWRLKSHADCTLDGVPGVTLYDASGKRVPAKVSGYSGWFGYKNVRSEPTLVGPSQSATIQIAKYRCDTTANPTEMTSATFTLPLGPGAQGDAGTIHVKLSQSLPYCPGDEGNQDVHVAPVGYSGEPPSPYAVNLHSDFDPGDGSTWGSTDIDGDGLADTVILRSTGRAHAMLEIEFGDGKRSENELGFRPARLQGFTDLNGDGVPEVLVASTTDGADAGYTFGSSESTVVELVPGDKSEPMAVVTKRGGPWMPYIATNGRGDLWSALQCHGEDVTEVKALLTGGGRYDAEGTNTYKVTRTTWHLDGGKATKLGTSTKTERLASRQYGRTWLPVASSCPGIGADGWAD